MALTAAGSALVAGSSQENTMQVQSQEVRVLRAFYFKGEPQKVGTKVTLPKILAIEVRAANKAEFVDEKTETAPVGGGGSKSAKLV